jgi:hypothetical protein
MKKSITKMGLLALLWSQPLLSLDVDKKIHTISESERDSIVEDSAFIMPSAGALANSLKMIFGEVKWSQFIDIQKRERGETNQERALNLGIEGADLFFLAIAEDVDNLTKISGTTNLILNKIRINGKSLNTTSRKKKLKKLKNLIKKRRWEIVLREISSLKEEINSDFTQKNRKDLALLNDVGGWLEGYRLTVEAMSRNYKQTESMILLQSPLISYLLKEVKLSNELKSFSKRAKLIEILEKVNSILSKAKNYQLSKAEVVKLSKIFGGKIIL